MAGEIDLQTSFRRSQEALMDLNEQKNRLIEKMDELFLNVELSNIRKKWEEAKLVEEMRQLQLNIDKLNAELEEQAKLISLKEYPNAERLVSGVVKAAMALLTGASTVVTIVVIGTSLNVVVLGGFVFGAIAYAVKAIRDVSKKNTEEKKLTQQLQNHLQRVEFLFDGATGFNHCKLDDTFNQLLNNQLLPSQIEVFHRELVKVQETLNISYPGALQKAEIKQSVAEKIKKIEKKYPEIRNNKADIHVIYPREIQQNNGWWLWTKVKQTGNRLLSFMAGASSAASVGVGVAMLAFGISNPVGWVLMSIVVGSLLVGAGAVAIDYFASRRQDRKIQALRDKIEDCKIIKGAVDDVVIEINAIHDATIQHHNQMAQVRLQDEQKILRFTQETQVLTQETRKLTEVTMALTQKTVTLTHETQELTKQTREASRIALLRANDGLMRQAAGGRDEVVTAEVPNSSVQQITTPNAEDKSSSRVLKQ